MSKPVRLTQNPKEKIQSSLTKANTHTLALSWRVWFALKYVLEVMHGKLKWRWRP